MGSFFLLNNKVLTLFPRSYFLKDGNDRGPQFHPLTSRITFTTFNDVIDPFFNYALDAQGGNSCIISKGMWHKKVSLSLWKNHYKLF